MGLKKRVKPKKTEVKAASLNAIHQSVPDKSKLRLVKLQNGDTTKEKELSSQNELLKKLNIYHHINDLFQDHSLSLSQLMNRLLDLSMNVLDCGGGSLWMFEEDEKIISCKVAVGPGGQDLIGAKVNPGKGVVGWVFENAQSTIVNNAQLDNRFAAKFGADTRNLIAAPLTYEGETIGVLELINKEGDEGFGDTDKFFLEDICMPSAMHIKTSRLMRKQKLMIARMKTFSDIHEIFSSTLELPNLLSLVLAKAIEIVHARVGSIWLVEDNGEGIECHIAEGPTKDRVVGVKIKKSVGIVGWVVDNNESQIVEDCSKDHRFSAAVDKKIGFVTESMITVPLTVKQEVIGAIQVLNKKGKGKLFDVEDLELLKLFGTSSAMYIKNARLYASEKKAKELSALISISKEITSTLDIDAVLMTIVNLSSEIIHYDEASISTQQKASDKWKICGISGADSVDRGQEKVVKLEHLHNLISSFEKEIYINGKINYNSEDEDYVPLLDRYMEKYELESFWGYVLKDDQGPVGIISMESGSKDLIPESKNDLLGILVGQSTVALRNADLYNTIPSSKALSSITEHLKQKIMNSKTWTPKRIFATIGTILGTIAALVFVPVPYNVNTNIEVVPITNTYYSETRGTVEDILVKEGQLVKAGQLLVRLGVNDQMLELKSKEVTRQKVFTEMLKNKSEKNTAGYKIKENEWLSLEHEIKLLKKKISSSQIKATASGIVVSENLDDLIGMPVNFGQELIRVAETELVYIQFEIPESEVLFVKAGQGVKFKVFGYPHNSFSEGIKLESVAGEGRPILETDPAKYFIAKAQVNNTSENLVLRPGMTGKGKIYADSRSLGYVIFNKPWRFLLTEVLF